MKQGGKFAGGGCVAGGLPFALTVALMLGGGMLSRHERNDIYSRWPDHAADRPGGRRRDPDRRVRVCRGMEGRQSARAATKPRQDRSKGLRFRRSVMTRWRRVG